MDLGDADERLPRVAATLLLAVGGLAFLAGIAVFFVSLPPDIVASLPADYRLLLAGLAVLGGAAHVLAGMWVRQRRPLFRIAAATLVGMVLLQVSAPVDILVLVALAISRDQFEDEALSSLEAIRAALEEHQFEVTSELSFTKDRAHLIDRIANMYDCTAVLSPGTVRVEPPESVLVLLRSDSNLDRIVTTLGTLFAESDLEILLFHAVESDDDSEAVEYMLHGVADRLADRDIDPDRIQWKQSDRGSRVDTIVSEVSDHDLVVLGETEPSVRERIFGPVQSGIADRTDRPSLIIRAGA